MVWGRLTGWCGGGGWGGAVLFAVEVVSVGCGEWGKGGGSLGGRRKMGWTFGREGIGGGSVGGGLVDMGMLLVLM